MATTLTTQPTAPQVSAELRTKVAAARAAAKALARLPTAVKNEAIRRAAAALREHQEEILAANAQDVEQARQGGSAAPLDRLILNPSRIEGIITDMLNVAALPDPVGEVIEMRTVPSGLQVGRVRVPLGVIGVIYEARPNVTVDISTLCLKAGNAVVLRGSKDALRSNIALVRVLREAIAAAGVPADALQLIESPDRSVVGEMLRLRGWLDVIIPRGGAELIRYVAENATVPVIETGAGVCHTFLERTADLAKAIEVIYNAKVRRPTICNALDTLLVDRAIAAQALPLVYARMAAAGVEMHCCPESYRILSGQPNVRPATDEDWGKEYLSLTMAVKVVDGLDEALAHIAQYGSGHSEAILTNDYRAAQRFLQEVDAAAVYVNASTQFTDGAQFGLGAEVGISTQKLHARGPMGLHAITTYKWIILGDGHVRP
jgi:glutamate-5-semialdehyde dehydrogenase